MKGEQKFIMIKLALEIEEKEMWQQWDEQGGCVSLLAGYLKAVSSVCTSVGNLLSRANCVHFFPQLTIPDYHVQFIFFIIQYFDNETGCTCVA